MTKPSKRDYDIALSFAGEDRPYVDAVARALKSKAVSVFYDSFEEEELWGKDLYSYLSELYQERAEFTVMFISEHYARKLWTNHERQAMQARAFSESREYVLPARFDDTSIQGVLQTTGYIDLKRKTPEEFAETCIKKLVKSGRGVPSEQVRRDFSAVVPMPLIDPTKCTVQIEDDQGQAIDGATVVLQADNGTILRAIASEGGTYTFDVNVRRSYRLLVAHPNFPSSMTEVQDPATSMKIVLQKLDGIGSALIESTGYLPGLKGRLNPILDTSNRTYLYADNIAINGGKKQPTTFVVDQPTELEDSDGTVMLVVVKHIAASVSLLQFMRRA